MRKSMPDESELIEKANLNLDNIKVGFMPKKRDSQPLPVVEEQEQSAP